MITLLLGCFASTPDGLVPVVPGIKRVTDLGWVGDTMVVAQQDGTLSWIDAEGKPHTWLSLGVKDGGERGLLGLAVDPDHAKNGRIVLSWTEAANDQLVSKVGLWTTTPGSKPGTAPLKPSTVLLTLTQPYANHNGGGVRFGPDGMLYVGYGDGGKYGDPLDAGQDGSTQLGAFLRLDPDLPAPHVPPDNPFVGDPGVHDTIFAIGVRNPWRFSFAPDGRLIAGDVGQNAWEEVGFVPRGGNLGWDHVEGWSCYERDSCEGDFVEPFWVYGHDLGNSVTGGEVARTGPYAGRYVFGDFGSGRIWSIALPDAGRAEPPTLIRDFSIQPSTFGLDRDGQVLVVDYGTGIYRLK